MVVAKTPPLRETPEGAAVAPIRAAPIRVALVATLAVVAEVGAAIAPPIPPPEEVAAGTAPQIRAALMALAAVEVVEATRAEEETLPTRAPRAAPTTRLTTSPTIPPPAPWTPTPWIRPA